MKAIGQDTVKQYYKKGEGGTDYYAVIRETNMDAVIVECAFLDNEIDNKIIDNIEEQELFGIAIAKGILAQLEISYNGESTKSEPVVPPSKTEVATENIDVTYQVYTGGRWLPNVTNLED